MRMNFMLGSDPFITFETPYMEDLNEFQAYMNHFYPEIKIITNTNRFNHTIMLGVTGKAKCAHVGPKNPINNFTFNTSHEHQFHIPASSMLFDTHLGQPIGECMFTLLMVHDPGFTQKALLIGDPFFKNFNVSLDFDVNILGI